MSYCDVEELALDRGLEVDHSSVHRWIIEYSTQLKESFRHKHPTGVSLRIAESYIKIKEQWTYLYLKKSLPKRLSSDHDPLFQFHRWQANLRTLEIEEIKTIPYTPISHPFIERLIRTCRNEIFDQTLFWSESDLNRKLQLFQSYFNQYRAHMGINQNIPNYVSSIHSKNVIDIKNYRWKNHCQNLFKLPTAA